MIVHYPNNILMSPTKEVSLFGRQRLDPIVNLLFEKNKQHHGVGLAFNQLGGQESIFVIDYQNKENSTAYMGVFINPEIVSHSQETVIIPERCLSFPGVQVNKERWKTIRIRWRDVESGIHEDEFTGMKSIIAQHEYDHCCGKTIISSLPVVKQRMLVEKMKKNNKKKTREEALNFYKNLPKPETSMRATKSARESAKEMGLPIPKDAQEKIDIYTGKRFDNE